MPPSSESGEPPACTRAAPEHAGRSFSVARWLLAGAVLSLFAALTLLGTIGGRELGQTAVFYLGLPALVALLVVLTARPRSAVGMSAAVLTVCLALAGPLLGEGLVCLVIAAPLLYGVVSLAAWMFARIAGRTRGSSNHALLALPLLAGLTLEGVGGAVLLSRADQGEGSRIVAASPERVAEALAAPPEYAEPEALFLSAVPFPEPVTAEGEGLEVGDTRTVTFTQRRTLDGAEPTPRHMELVVAESEVRADGGRVVFDVVDDTAFARWMDMRRAEAVWSAEADDSASSTGTSSRLTWRIDYERTYEPSWYFGPLQSYATDLAAAYLADTFGAAAVGEPG